MSNSKLAFTIFFSILFLVSPFVHADTDRAGKWEATFQILGNSAESTGGEGQSSLDVDSQLGWGFGIGYNLNSHFAVNFDASFIKPDYEATLDTEDDGLVTIDHDMSVFNGQLNGVWNFMDGPFTPYVQAGIGWTYIDSNVSDGPPSTGCWWDPWWGYVCANFYDSYDDTSFSYGAGLGLRYEFGYQTFIKGSYNFYEVKGSGDGADPQFDIWRIEIGKMF